MWSDLIIIVFLVFMWCWDYPADHPAKKFITKFSFPFIYMGFWHGWAMFAPEPIHVNRRMKALLYFDDGTTEIWRPLAPEYQQKLINLLYARSFKYEYTLLNPRMSFLYQPLCDFLIGQSNSASQKVVGVELIRDTQQVNAIGSEAVYRETTTDVFYRYDAVKRVGAVVPSAVRQASNPQSGKPVPSNRTLPT
jgi:hypothetical protein